MTKQTEEPLTLCSEQFKKAYNAFDKDGNGLITVKEFKKAMAGLGKKLSEKKVKKIMKEVDLDGNECINYQGKYLQ